MFFKSKMIDVRIAISPELRGETRGREKANVVAWGRAGA